MSTPPGSCRASNTSTLMPAAAQTPAQVSEAGPEPMQAIFLLPSGTAQELVPVTCSQAEEAMWLSATKRSRRPMATGWPLALRMQLPSHWFSCGQTRPQTAGRLLVALMMR